jgi:hypothetical protein
LIGPIDGQWDVQLVSDTFSVEDARLILQMPLRDDTTDFIAWHFDEKGIHSVRQAYKIIHSE